MKQKKIKYWCRYCKVHVNHIRVDGDYAQCCNCGLQTPPKAFKRYCDRREAYEKKIKEKQC